MTSVAEKKAETAAEAETTYTRVAPLVHVDCVHLNKAGSVYAGWSVRFPEGGTREDLTQRDIWRRIQDTLRPPIRRFDEVRILAHDASWVAHCIAAHATDSAVDLTVISITKLPEQRERLFEDDRFAVRFAGSGYSVQRKSDNQEMVAPVHSAAAAETNLRNLYPKQVT